MRKTALLLILFLLGLSLNAQITYVDVNPDCSSAIITGQTQSGLCPINLPGGNSISFRWDSFSPTEWFYHVEGSNGGVNIAQSSVANNPYGKPYANVFTSGASIDATATYSNSANNDPLISDSYRANFSGQGDRYVGFRFLNAGQTFYGWILVNSTGQGLTVKEYAYRTTANTAINAGDKGALSTKDYVNASNVGVYPNPAVNFLNLKTDVNISSVKIYSVSGLLVRNETETASNNIDVSNLQKGCYFVKVNDFNVVPFIKE